METTPKKREEALVIIDHQGIHYAIPREVVEHYRATEEQRAEIEALRGEDVTGYFGPAELFIHEETMPGIVTERLQEADRERKARDARMAARNVAIAMREHQPGFISVVAAFTGWLTPQGLVTKIR